MPDCLLTARATSSPSLLTPSHPKLYSTLAHFTVLETHQASCPISLCTPRQGTLTRVILKGTNSHFSHSQFPRPLRAPELVDTLMSQYQPPQYTIPICIGPGLLHLSLGCSPSLVPSPVLDHKSTCSLCKTPQNALTSAPAITWSCPPPQPHHPISSQSLLATQPNRHSHMWPVQTEMDHTGEITLRFQRHRRKKRT